MSQADDDDEAGPAELALRAEIIAELASEFPHWFKQAPRYVEEATLEELLLEVARRIKK